MQQAAKAHGGTRIMTRQMLATHPDWAEINAQQWLLIALINPQLFYDGAALKAEILEPERHALVEKAKKCIGFLLEGGVFRDYIVDELDLDELNLENHPQ